ncbi:MAG: helix-turn-helix domain-containing protein [Candidatus Hodarchaeales archaeon]|jgi:predicted DNA binding protein
MLYNYIIELQTDDLYSNFSQKHPHLEFLLWCNYQHDILEIRGEKVNIENAKSEFQNALGPILEIYPENTNTQFILKLCKCAESSVSKILEKYDCLELPPVKYFQGREILNLVITSESTRLIERDIKKENPNTRVKVLKLAPLKKLDNPYPLYLPLDSLKRHITRRQLEALTVALNRGYYEIPRMAFLETLAKEMSIKRRTFEDHLRKAEKKIMDSIIPALMLSKI